MFSEKLKKSRIKAKLSQEEVAEKINTSRSNISKYETGNLEPNITTLRELCKLYKVSADYILDLEDREKNIENNISIKQGENGNTSITINNK